MDNQNKQELLNRMNSTASRVGLGDLIFSGSGGVVIGFRSVAVSGAIVEDDGLVNVTAAGTTQTLPLAADVPAGKRFEVAFSGGAGSVAPAGSDTIAGVAGSFAVDQYTRVVVTSDGVSNWIL